jgi:hypothetical protein
MDIRTLPGWPTYISVNGLPLDLYGDNIDKEQAAALVQFITQAPQVLEYLQKELAQPYITERDKRIMRSKIDELLKLIR